MFIKIARSFYTILTSLILAILFGHFFPGKAQGLKAFGGIYSSTVLMVVIPILCSLLLSSVIKISTGQTAGLTRKRIFSFIFITLTSAATIGAILALLMNPSQGIAENPSIAEKVYNDVVKNITEIDLNDPVSKLNSFHPGDFLEYLVPHQIFKPLVEGHILQILILAVIIGTAISALANEKSQSFLNFLKTTYELFQKILSAILLFMPIGLFFIVSSSVASLDKAVFPSLINFYTMVTITNFVIIAVGTFITCYYHKISLRQYIQCFKEPIIIAFSTSSNQATIPFLMRSITEGLGFKQQQVSLVTPLCVSLNRTATVMYFAFLSIFIAQLYNTPIGIFQVFFIIIGAMVLGMAATGINGIVALSMLSIILNPLSLPVEAIIPILIMIDPLLEPIRTVTSLNSNIATITIIINKERQKLTHLKAI